jgi:hypothetical protein
MSELGIRKLDQISLAKNDLASKDLVVLSKRVKGSDESDTSSEEPDDRLQRMSQAIKTVIEVRFILQIKRFTNCR